MIILDGYHLGKKVRDLMSMIAPTKVDKPRHLKGSSTVLVELSKTEQHSWLKVDKVAKTVTHPFYCFNRVVHPFDHARCESMSEVI